MVEGSGCFEPGQVVPGRMVPGSCWDLVLSATSGEGFCEVNSANTPFICHYCSQPGMGQSGTGGGQAAL